MRWVDALKEWNKGSPTWCIARKGTKAYDEVKAIMAGKKIEAAEAPKKIPMEPQRKMSDSMAPKVKFVEPAPAVVVSPVKKIRRPKLLKPNASKVEALPAMVEKQNTSKTELEEELDVGFVYRPTGRRMEQSIFEDIVRMAGEMERAEQPKLAREGLARIDAAFYAGIRLDADDVEEYMIEAYQKQKAKIKKIVKGDREEFLDGNSFMEIDCLILGTVPYGLTRGYIFPIGDTYALQENIDQLEENADEEYPADSFSEAENGSVESLENAVRYVKIVQDQLLRDAPSSLLHSINRDGDFFKAFIKPERVDEAIKKNK